MLGRRVAAHKGFFNVFSGRFRNRLGPVKMATTRYCWTPPGGCESIRPVKRILRLAALLLFCVLTFAARCHNLRDVFLGGKIYFADADCYSRMTRARMVAEHPGLIVRHHDFENFPQGVKAHTTAPLDYLIVAGKKLLDAGFALFDSGKTSVLRGQTLDLAGALISPLLGVLTCGWLAVWAWSATGHSSLVRAWAAPVAPLFFAISPIAVHGTVLGRPDHQSLIMFLLAIIIGAETRLMQTVREWEKQARPPDRHIAQWAVISGLAGGLAMWVSLYEPLVLFGVIFLLIALFDREQFRWRERWRGWAAGAAVYAVSLGIEGWRYTLPDETVRAYFPNWSRTIGELAHLDLTGPLLWHWCGWAAALAPVALGLAVWMKMKAARASTGAHPAYRPAAFLLGLLLVTFALTCWQLRWGYFFVLVFAMSLPWQLAVLRRWWIAWPAFVVSIYPVAQDWDARLFPDDVAQQRLAVKRAESVALRDIVAAKTGANGGPFLAPWWLSPSIAYWTRQPGVAGSSHESLPGIVDAARVWLAPDAAAALPILRARGVTWILADEPERTVPTSATLLGVPPPAKCLAQELARSFPELPPDFPLVPETDAPRAQGFDFFHIWRVRAEAASVPAP